MVQKYKINDPRNKNIPSSPSYLIKQNFLLTIFHHHVIQFHLFQVMDFHDQFVELVMKLTIKLNFR